MALVVTNDGAIEMSAWRRDRWNDPATAVEMRLFQNNYTPIRSSDIGDFTEATFSGYAAVVLTGWANAGIVGDRAKLEADRATFEHNGGGVVNDVYGYFIWDPVAGLVLWAERDPDGPVSMSTAGDKFEVDPVFTLKSEFP